MAKALLYSAAVTTAVLTGLMVVKPVRAQQTGLALKPAIFEHTVDAGGAESYSIAVQNTSATPLPLKVHARQLEIAKDARLAEGAESAAFDASQWLQFKVSEFILQPHETREVAVEITVPPNAEPGGHYATILFTPVIGETARGTNSTYQASEVGSLAFITVKGDIEEGARILKPARATRLQPFGPAEVTYEFENFGNVHNLPTGAIRVVDFFGKEVHKTALPPRTVLPGTIQPYKLRWGRALMLNRFTVTAEFSYGAPAQTLAAPTVTVWVVPWLPLLAGTSLLLAGLIVMVKTRGRWRQAWRALRGKA